MTRYYCLVGDEHAPYVITESPDKEAAEGTFARPRIYTRDELLSRYPEALAAWEAGDDSAYLAYVATDAVAAKIQEAPHGPIVGPASQSSPDPP
jgi:hypothetical protein